MASGSLRYAPYRDLDEAHPSVVVDGSPAPGTVLCLSHWPGMESPPQFWADLSAEMALHYAGAFDRHGAAQLVSNNHFDQDGLVGVYALVEPDQARARQEFLVEVARAGDFATTRDRRAARVSMVVSAYADRARSPLPGLGDTEGYDEATALLYDELLGRLPEICDHLDAPAYRSVWAEEDDTLRASEALLASGTVRIEEVPDVDVAVVRVPPDAPDAGGHRFGGDWVHGLHPIAVHNATERGALLTVGGDRFTFAYRYESWVQLRSRRVRPRVDLAPLTVQLNEAEAGAGSDARWTAQAVSALTPTLSTIDGHPSGLGPGEFVSLVVGHLRAAPPAWDPYAPRR
jgi:Family of unknown function (DUF6687)